MNLNFYDYTLNFNWDMFPIDRSFDPIKVQLYLSLLNEHDRYFIYELLNSTTYVDYFQFKQALFQSFKLFQQNINNEEFYLLLTNDKIGSEHWLSALLWPQLRILNIQDIISETSKLPLKITNILIIDDAIYSGWHTFSTVFDFVDNLANYLNIEENEVGKYFKWHFVIPFISYPGTNAIRSKCTEWNTSCNFYSINYLPDLDELIDIDIRKYFPVNTENVIYQKFGIHDIDKPPIYFDHKVAGKQSTFITIYLDGRLPNGESFGSLLKTYPSREKIEEIIQLYHNWLNFNDS